MHPGDSTEDPSRKGIFGFLLLFSVFWLVGWFDLDWFGLVLVFCLFFKTGFFCVALAVLELPASGVLGTH